MVNGMERYSRPCAVRFQDVRKTLVQFSAGLGTVQGVYDERRRLAAATICSFVGAACRYTNWSDGSHLPESHKDGELLRLMWTIELSE